MNQNDQRAQSRNFGQKKGLAQFKDKPDQSSNQDFTSHETSAMNYTSTCPTTE